MVATTSRPLVAAINTSEDVARMHCEVPDIAGYRTAANYVITFRTKRENLDVFLSCR
jgi:hypothetical protein